VLCKRWLPGQDINEQTMGEALFLERRYIENMKNAVSAGIDQVL
jgi:hypothetical protein